MNRDTLVQRLADEVVQDKKLALRGWLRIVVVLAFDDAGPSVSAYCFLKNERYQAALPSSNELEELVANLRSLMAKEDKKEPWVACLLSLQRRNDSAAIDLRFEYENRDRWRVTPGNLERRVKEFARDPQ